MPNPFAFRAFSPSTVPAEEIFRVPDADFFLTSEIAHNAGQSCGYVGATLLHAYWQHRELKSLTEAGKAVVFADPAKARHQQSFHDKLLTFARRHSSWAFSVAYAWSRLAGKLRLPGQIIAKIFWFGVYRSLRRGEPVVLFGGIPDVSTAEYKYINHAVVAYGYWQGREGRALLVHYGWQGHNAWLLKTPFQGSAIYFRPEG